jgi:hypothetical protein
MMRYYPELQNYNLAPLGTWLKTISFSEIICHLCFCFLGNERAGISVQFTYHIELLMEINFHESTSCSFISV